MEDEIDYCLTLVVVALQFLGLGSLGPLTRLGFLLKIHE